MPDDTPQVLSLDQKRAAYAWTCVQQVPQAQHKDYENLAKGAPALIMNNGLMQTLAFYWSKARGEKGFKEDKKYYALLLAHLLAWLRQMNLLNRDSFKTAMNELSSMSTSRYRLTSSEALEILKWIRQLATARGSATEHATEEE